MPTLPLYNADAQPDAWHQVRAPGGYECWRFEADDVDDDRQVIVELWHGDGWNADYVQAFNRYLRNPTRTPPPVPQQFIAVRSVVVHQGKLGLIDVQPISLDQFTARADRADVRLGASRFIDEDGTLRLSIQTKHSLQLAFTPRFMPDTARLDLNTHHWHLTHPVCDVTGELRMDSSEPIAIRGRGCHDHLFGDRPLKATAERWLRGRVIADDRCVAFQVTGDNSASITEVTASETRRHDTGGLQLDWQKVTCVLPNVLELYPPRVLQGSTGIARYLHEAKLYGKRARCISELV